jgi:DNA-binding response OmpR family regulator
MGESHLSESEKVKTDLKTFEKENSLLHLPKPKNNVNEEKENFNYPLILIVEDDRELGEFIKQVLEDHRFAVQIAMDGHKGLELAIKENPDLIISDIMMPKMDGFELCSQLKSTFLTSHIPLIILTSLTAEENRLRGDVCGADAYIFKPFSERVIVAKIKNLLNLRKRLRKYLEMEIMLDSNEIKVTTADEQFMGRVLEIIDQHMEDPDFNVEILAKQMAMSRSVLFKKIKSFVGLAPNEFIHIIKLKRAEAMLLKGGKKVAEVAYKLGFSNPKTFRAQFKKYYNQTPSEYVQNHQKDQ